MDLANEFSFALGNFRGMRQRGITTSGFLLTLAVIAIAGSILFFLNRSILLNNDESSDTKKMRDIVTAIDLYEQQNNELPPLDLKSTLSDLGDKSLFAAANDPYTLGSDFPIDPAFPDSKERSSFRISFTYLPQWIANGKVKSPGNAKLYEDSKVGLLACYWYGDVNHLRPDGLDASGPIVRIRMDGSAITLNSRKSSGPLNAADLFNVPANQ